METRLLGIEIGGTKLQIAIGDEAGKIIGRTRFTVDSGKSGAGIRSQIEAALPGLLKQFTPRAIGVGFGGPVDCKTGRICCSHQIEGWSDFPMGDWLTSLARIPVFVDNDANIGALGEALHGSGQLKDPVFYVTMGSGIGGGLIAGGKIYHGAKPGESEIGHIRLDRQGTTVESRCSGWAVDAKLRMIKKREPEGLLSRMIGDATFGEAKFLRAAIDQNDSSAAAVLRETAGDLAFALSHVVHLFHPEIIVLGGGLALVGEPLRLEVERVLRPFTMEAFAPGPAISLSTLGEDAVPVGALALAAQQSSK